MIYDLLDERLREPLKQIRELWWVREREACEEGIGLLLDLIPQYEGLVQQEEVDGRSVTHVLTLSYLRYKQARFRGAESSYLKRGGLRYDKANACRKQLEEVQEVCTAFAEREKEISASAWLQLHLLATEALREKAFISANVLLEYGHAASYLAAAEKVIHKIMSRHQAGELQDCINPYVERAYDLGGFVTVKRGWISEKNRRFDIALFCYRQSHRYNSWLAKNASCISGRERAVLNMKKKSVKI